MSLFTEQRINFTALTMSVSEFSSLCSPHSHAPANYDGVWCREKVCRCLEKRIVVHDVDVSGAGLIATGSTIKGATTVEVFWFSINTCVWGERHTHTAVCSLTDRCFCLVQTVMNIFHAVYRKKFCLTRVENFSYKNWFAWGWNWRSRSLETGRQTQQDNASRPCHAACPMGPVCMEYSTLVPVNLSLCVSTVNKHICAVKVFFQRNLHPNFRLVLI